MSSSPEAFQDHDDIHEPSPALTPVAELARGDGHRWAALDVADLDPPTPLLPYTVD